MNEANPRGETDEVTWFRVGSADIVDDGAVTVVQAGHHTIALSRIGGTWGAIANRCPHQGGPLGEGLIENCWLVCPWHGWEYDPVNGETPGPFDDKVESYEVEERADGIYVGVHEPGVRGDTFMSQIVDRLVACGVDTVFGIVGHSNLGFSEAVRAAEKAGELKYIGVRHEGAASFAASAYSKLTTRPAVCLAIAGPGATNLYTGMWDAKLSTTPLLAITGQIPTAQLGTRAFQEVPIEIALGPATGWSKRLSASDGPGVATAMVNYATTQKDVALLVIPDDVQTLPAGNDTLRGPSPLPNALSLTTRDTETIAGLLAEAQNPLFVIGRGGTTSSDKILALAEHIDAAVATTFPAKGAIPESHPLATGVLGRSGTPISAAMQTRSDLIVVFGGGMAPHTGITNKRTVIRIDTDPLASRRNTDNVAVFALSDAGLAASALAERCEPVDRPELRTWLADRWEWWRARKLQRRSVDNNGRLTSAAVFHELAHHIPHDAIVALDVGNTTYSFGRYFEADGQRVVMSGWLGSIGYALPAAIGAAAAYPDLAIVAIAGDGGFAQYAMELATVAKYELNIKVVLLSNDEFGKISAEQQMANTHVWSTSLKNPSWAGMADSLGLTGLYAATPSELETGMAELFSHTGPGLLEIRSSRLQY